MFKAIVDRVWRSYKSTLVGLGIGVAVMVLDSFATAWQGSDSPYLKIIASLAVVIGASLKSKSLPPAP